MKQYTDVFIDFDDTLYDTHGNADIALREIFQLYELHKYFDDQDVFYNTYWKVNAEVWDLYAKGEMSKDELIVERFRRPFSLAKGLVADDSFCRKVNQVFLR